MRLRKIIVGTWDVLAETDDCGRCELQAELEALFDARKTKATAAGFYSFWRHIPAEGPRKLGTDIYHQLDSADEIYEFIKGDYRVLCFQVRGRVILCSHLMRKKSQKTPRREIDRAKGLRKAYLAAEKANELIVEEE
ncbi:type II toxin-antitoxin system RelE/ParE family toxin [Lysobacter gummosus]|uniref:type II toxin-antitoxin system RelE/ParE family toxin n=1 Tax=Lysobacter gummosus TaxID=262324 RepID=UPI00362A1EFA